MMRMLVLFAHWCPKCNMMMPIIDELEIDYGEWLEIERINIDEKPDAMEAYAVKVVPTFILYQGKKEVGRMSGLIGEKKLYERLDAFIEK